jgi:hypothetical protein
MSQPIYSPTPPPPPPPPVSASASNQAITALVLGILGLVCCSIAAPFAWYFGQTELTAIRDGRSSTAGEGMAMAGKITGIIGTIIMVFALLWILFFGGMAVIQGMAHR